jgi:hypothetical protein
VNNFTDEFYYGTGNLNDVLGIGSVVPGKSETYGVEFYYNWKPGSDCRAVSSSGNRINERDGTRR